MLWAQGQYAQTSRTVTEDYGHSGRLGNFRAFLPSGARLLSTSSSFGDHSFTRLAATTVATPLPTEVSQRARASGHKTVDTG